jgi:hypothetical protein
MPTDFEAGVSGFTLAYYVDAYDFLSQDRSMAP